MIIPFKTPAIAAVNEHPDKSKHNKMWGDDYLDINVIIVMLTSLFVRAVCSRQSRSGVFYM